MAAACPSSSAWSLNPLVERHRIDLRQHRFGDGPRIVRDDRRFAALRASPIEVLDLDLLDMA
jgi:hypothetical protein